MPAKEYLKRKAEGLCVQCGKNKVVRGFRGKLTTYCKKCLEAKIKKQRKYMDERFPHLKIAREKKEKISQALNKEIEKM